MGCTSSKPAAQSPSPVLETRSSSYRSRGSAKDHAVSVNLWGGNSSGHWGTTLHKRGAEEGDLYHVQKRDGTNFRYEVRSPMQVMSKNATGRSEVSHISQRGKDRAEVLLNRYGQDTRNIPDPGNTNCQHWNTGAIGTLERERLTPAGTQAYWRSQIGKPSNDIGRTLEREGKSWQANANNNQPHGPADARFGQQERPATGRLNTAAFANLAIPAGPGRGRGTSGGRSQG